VLLGVANGAIVVAIYQRNLPSTASVRTADPHDGDIEQTRKASAWTSAAFLGFMFLLTRDRNSFLIGGLVLAGIDITVKHGNGLNPSTGKLDSLMGESMGHEDLAAVYPMPDYETVDGDI
jgi:hypothetical protein